MELMKTNKVKYIIIGLVAICCSIGASAQRGEKSLGLLAGYNTRIESGVAGIYFQYRFSSYFRLAPNLQFLIQRNNVSSYAFNMDAHFPLLGQNKVNVYPIAGISFQSWRYKPESERFTDNKLGIDAGAGIELKITPTLKTFTEAKYTLIKRHKSGNIVIGLGYCF